MPYMEELTVFIKVRMPSLNESSKLILDRVSNEEIRKRDNVPDNIIIKTYSIKKGYSSTKIIKKIKRIKNANKSKS